MATVVCTECTHTERFKFNKSDLIGVKCPHCGVGELYVKGMRCPRTNNQLTVTADDINTENDVDGWMVSCPNHQNNSKKHSFVNLRV